MLKYLLLALLAQQSRHGYELRSAFEELLAGSWVLNIGQVYTALAKLEQDGLVRAEVVPQELLPDRKVYSLTEVGAKELTRWMEDPSDAPIRIRDDLFFKVLSHLLVAGNDWAGLITTQREAYLHALAEIAKLRLDRSNHPSTQLLLEGMALRMEADVKWLDLCEQRLKGRRR